MVSDAMGQSERGCKIVKVLSQAVVRLTTSMMIHIDTDSVIGVRVDDREELLSL